MKRALVTLVFAAHAAAEPVTFVNSATDGASGQHTLKVIRDAVLKKEPGAEKALKSYIVLEEPSAHAPPTPKQILGEVSKLLNEAKAAYSRSNLDVATESIAQAEAMAMSTEPWPETFSALAELERLSGLIALKQKDSAAADEAFRNAFLLNPALTTLDSSMGTYARLLKSKDRGTGQLDIRVDPITAWVMIDGQKGAAGVTPSLEAGTHYISASREGYGGQIQRVSVQKGKTTVASITLSEAGSEQDLVVARYMILAAQSEAAMAIGAKKIAALTKTRFVVLVRPDDAALYDNQSAQLGPFVPVEKIIGSTVDAVRGKGPQPLMTEADLKAADLQKQEEAKALTAVPTPWWQKPWVIGAGAGAVVVIGAIVAGSVYAATRPPVYTYSVNSWCHASDCPPLN